MNAPLHPTLPTVAAPLRDLGPLAWVMDELRQALDEGVQAVAQFAADNQAARQTDLSEIDSSAMRMTRQHLHQAAGALDMVGLAAAATTLRALEAAVQRLMLKPALATAESADTVRTGAHAVVEYLSRLMRQKPVPALALYPTYRDWQQLAGAARAHPADLWEQAHADVVLPPGKVYDPGPPVRAHLERLVLQVVKSLNPQAAIPLAQLSGGLARGAADLAVRRFWAAAAAYFEAVALGRLPDVVYVKRAASSVLLQYSQLAQGDTQSLTAHTHDLLCLAARAVPDQGASNQMHLHAVWAAHGWRGADAWDAEARALGSYDPAALEALRTAVASVQQAWALWCEGDAGAARRAEVSLVALARGLIDLLPANQGLAGLGATWSAVAQHCAGARRPPGGLALEASSSLLLLEAELDDFDSWDAQAPDRYEALAQRLSDALRGQAAAEPQAWMSERYQSLGERSTRGHVVAQWRAELDAVEQVLDTVFRQSPPEALPDLGSVQRRLEAMSGIATLLELPAARRTVEILKQELESWPVQVQGLDQPFLQAAAERLAPNVSALGWLLDTFARQPDLARAGFAFDESAQRLLPPVQGPASDLPLAPPASAAPAPAPLAPPDQDDGTELLAVFVDEALAILDGALKTLEVLRLRPDSEPDLAALRRGFHTLKGSARMVGLTDVGAAAWAVEQLLNTWLAERKPASADLLALSEQSLAYLRHWVQGLQAGLAQDQAGQAQGIRASADALRLEGRWLPLGEEAGPTRPEPPLLQEVVEAPLTQPQIPVLEEVVKVIGPLRIDLDLYNVFLNEADEGSRRLWLGLSQWLALPAQPQAQELSLLAHALAGGAATVGHQGLAQLARSIEHALDRARSVLPAPTITPGQAEVWRHAADELQQLLHQFAAGFLRDPQPDTLHALDALVFEPALPAPDAQAPVEAEDRIDADLFAVFEDEAQELLPRLSAALRQWVARPDNQGACAEALRNLHTLKGSARLAGALRLGDMAHQLESAVLALPEQPEQPDPAGLAALQTAADAIVARFDLLRRAYAQAAPAAAAPPAGAPDIRVELPEGLRPPAMAPAPQPPAGAQVSVRVRADLLDQIMTQAGDVMISRTRLDNDMRVLRQSFKDMGSNLERLRSQLRDLELQTEMQMQSRRVHSRETDHRFDPLEFDRYTRVQELTRLLAESVNDVATVQHHLKRSVEAAEGNLAAQARQTRELQRDLLRTRLLAFDTLDERLHRVVRQAADAAGRQVELTLQNSEVEVDRAVLERLTPVLEHLLRNAVVHGIEPPDVRQARGKPLAGHIVIALEPRGNDLALTVSDDGAGLDVEGLRQRAQALQMHSGDAPFTEDDAARCMFAPGVSTAAEVTEMAGRGIGLDVVRNEVLGLGGRIEVLRPDGGGTALRLVVPLSTAVTQVVMLRLGHFVFGVPAPWVENVRRAQAPELTAAYLSGQWRGGSEPMPFYWAGALLALSPESTDPQAHEARHWPVLEFASAGQRVAWHVDEVLGQQEVVVKPMGPQLERLPGLTGATVLASGAVALIYNPVALAVLYGDASRAWARQQRAAGWPARPSAAPGDGGALVQAPLVLVVDDSITVRRVTQRLLKREGYRVALAADGLLALERLREERPVVVLCDIEMPRMDGFELVQHLRDDPAWADLPVVMITSRLADKHREHAERVGVNHYLGKPYAEDELLALVAAYARLAPGPGGLPG